MFSRLLRGILDRNVLGCVQLLEEIVMQGRELTQFVTDFTWYLRNLMLVQTSDNLEDVIDMSTDNLKRLKEESAMADMDRIVPRWKAMHWSRRLRASRMEPSAVFAM